MPLIIKAAVLNFFVFKMYKINIIYKRVHHESIFQTVFLAYAESVWHSYNKCLYSDYFRLVRVGTAAE